MPTFTSIAVPVRETPPQSPTPRLVCAANYGDNHSLAAATGTTTKLKFTSYERDGESGNDYALGRYYENRLGRFTATDPLAGAAGNPQSLNRYSYVGNDPSDEFDPSITTTTQASGGRKTRRFW